MNIAQQAYNELIGGSCLVSLKYSRKFKGYNANVKMRGSNINFNASSLWRNVSPEIQKGLYQELLIRLFKSRKHSLNIDLYNHFMRSLPRVAPKTKTHPVLEDSFNRVNNLMFNEMLEKPNLVFSNGTNQLGSYEYGTDTITISRILLDNQDLLDYVMYHELLHKKHQFRKTGIRTLHHSKTFKTDEAKFPNASVLDKELEKLVRLHKRRSWFW